MTSVAPTFNAQAWSNGHIAYEHGRHVGKSASTQCSSLSRGAHRRVSLPDAITTLGVQTAAAICEMPVSLQTTRRTRATSAASPPNVVLPARLMAGRLIAA